ncbi:cytochrome C biogenesis protein CcdA, partial [Klebsiella pneumoniae]|nr:cytochrome C biogenesis protein CcdA [Klebsiella pneumoniae]
VLWCVFHVLFLVFGLGRANYALILLFYGIRGLAYPLFLYSFIVAIIHNVRSDSSSSALGWFWAVYSVGIGVFGSLICVFIIAHIRVFVTPSPAPPCFASSANVVLGLKRHTETPRHMQKLTTREKIAELGRA